MSKELLNLYKKTLSTFPGCAIYVLDKEYNYLLAEGAELQKMGLDSDMLVGANFFEIWPPEVTAALGPHLQDALAGKTKKTEQKIGERFLAHNFIPLTDTQLVGINEVLLIAQDLSELEFYKEKLTKTQEEVAEYTSLINHVIGEVGEGILVCSVDGEILYQNSSACTIFSLGIDEQSIDELYQYNQFFKKKGGELLMAHQLPINMALTGMEVNHYELYHLNHQAKAGGYFEVSTKSLQKKNGEIYAAVMVLRNIDTRKAQEELVEQNLTKLKLEKDSLESLFVWISKNLRGPSANISLLLGLIEQAENQEDKQELYLKVKEANNTLDQSIGELSQVYLDKILVSKSSEECHLQAVLKKTITKFRADIPFDDIEVHVNFEAAPKVFTNTKILANVFYECLDNAVKFKHPKRGLELVIESWKEKDSICVSIADNGIGIDLDRYGSKLFQPYETLNQKEGRGLGLFTVKSQLNSINAKIEVESAIQVGTRFVVKFKS